MRNMVVGTLSVVSVIFMVCAILYYNISCQSGDVFYNPTLKTDSPLIVYYLIKVVPNFTLALAEIMTQVDRYGTFDEGKFSKALDTQLRRNLIICFVYLRLRVCFWRIHKIDRQECGLPWDYNPYKSRYSFFS